MLDVKIIFKTLKILFGFFLKVRNNYIEINKFVRSELLFNSFY